MKVVFNFGGFYGSIYNEIIDDVVYDEDSEIDVDAIDFKLLHIEVSKRITEQFNEFLSDVYDISTDFKFDSLDSPKFYNYSTDVIILDVSKKDRKVLDLLVSADEDIKEALKETVKDKTTSVSGYIPFYNYKEVMAKIDKDNKKVYYQCLLDVLIELNSGEFVDITTELLNETVSNNI